MGGLVGGPRPAVPAVAALTQVKVVAAHAAVPGPEDEGVTRAVAQGAAKPGVGHRVCVRQVVLAVGVAPPSNIAHACTRTLLQIALLHIAKAHHIAVALPPAVIRVRVGASVVVGVGGGGSVGTGSSTLHPQSSVLCVVSPEHEACGQQWGVRQGSRDGRWQVQEPVVGQVVCMLRGAHTGATQVEVWAVGAVPPALLSRHFEGK
jgi:hypothetical protein